MTDTKNKIDFNRSTARDYKCNFVFGNSPNEYVSVSNRDFTIENESHNPNNVNNSKEKGKSFRKHNYIVGYSKPEYQSLSASIFKDPDNGGSIKSDLVAALNDKKESRRSHFSFGNEAQIDPLNTQKITMKLSEFGKHMQAAEAAAKHNNETKPNPRNHRKSIFSLMKQQNIVYGYEKLSPYWTSNNSYKSSNPNAFPKHISGEVDQKLRKASFGFGNNEPEYNTSNMMQTYKIKKDENADNWVVGSNKNSPKVNKSHFTISQVNNSVIVNSTTYNDSIWANTANTGEKRDPNSFKRHKEVNSSIVLGFQKQEMLSETKDKFVKLSPKYKEIHRYANTSHIKNITPINGKSSSCDDRYKTTEEVFRDSSKTPSMNWSDNKLLNTAASLEHKMNSQSTHFSIGYNQQNTADQGKPRYSNKILNGNRFKKTSLFKPAIGNFGIDNFQLANKSLRKVNNSFATTNMEYSWIKPVQNG